MMGTIVARQLACRYPRTVDRSMPRDRSDPVLVDGKRTGPRRRIARHDRDVPTGVLRNSQNPFAAGVPQPGERDLLDVVPGILLMAVLALACSTAVRAEVPSTGRGTPLPGTEQLTHDGDLAAFMVAGIDRFLTQELENLRQQRCARRSDDHLSGESDVEYVAGLRERLRRIVGVVDSRPTSVDLELLATTAQAACVAHDASMRVLAVRWPALEGLDGEGLLIEPRAEPTAFVIAIPDADWTPEMLAGLVPDGPAGADFACRLARQDCAVLIPTLISRDDTFSGNSAVRMTNQPHREYIYRLAYPVGRHIIGFEVQKVLAAVDHFALRVGSDKPIGVIGYGEGGLIAMVAAALDPRIVATVVSGHFAPREQIWSEPIYRNVWSLLRDFGDAELAGLVAPRRLLIEASRGPIVAGPPPPRPGRSGAAPGRLESPQLSEVQAEFVRAQAIYRPGAEGNIALTISGDGDGPPGCSETLAAFLDALGAARKATPQDAALTLIDERAEFDPQVRQRRQFEQMVAYTQTLAGCAESRRAEFWSAAASSSPQDWQARCDVYRRHLWEEVIGRLPDPNVPLRPRTRNVYDEPAWCGYEVLLDVWPDVVAHGILLVPKDLPPGQRRPVVVCQHGLEGGPRKTIDPEFESTYARFAVQLVQRGFIVYAPQNPYVGEDTFRVLQRKANPLKLSLYSFIVGQHQRTLQWLSSLPCVDPDRIGFYGISYGGRTALMVPPLLERQYALAICSAYFNEWVWKTTSLTFPASYLFTGEYEIIDFDVANTFNHAELAYLIAPRPFMVERGHDDPVAPDHWVAYEYAKVARRYGQLGWAQQTAIEYFDGVHQIHGQGTFDFLHQHLKWPEP